MPPTPPPQPQPSQSSQPSTPRAHSQHLSRDQRLQVQTLRLAGHPYKYIANLLKITERQVAWAATSSQVTPKRRSGRPQTLTDSQTDELEAYIRSSRRTRQLSYRQLAGGPFAGWGVTEHVIRRALQRRGYSRCVARAKPPLTERSKAIRLQWALDHVDWEPWQWWRILWSDETWVTGGRHRRRWVTRKAGEELNPTCVIDKIPKKRGWMFWACFSGAIKGPSLFWEKEWKSINKESYCERIVPLVHGWLRLNPDLQFMQDSAPGHAAGYTLTELEERGIVPIYWPAFSPDLNPIELVWNQMKDYIEACYPDLPGGRQRTYDQLRGIVQEAWDSITPELLAEVIETMRDRCQAVIDAQGGYTKY
jgi:transposase